MPSGLVPYSNQHAPNVDSTVANLHKCVDTYLHPHLRASGPVCRVQDSYPDGYHIGNACPHWSIDKFTSFLLILLVPFLITFLDVHLLSSHRVTQRRSLHLRTERFCVQRLAQRIPSTSRVCSQGTTQSKKPEPFLSLFLPFAWADKG